VFNVTAPENTLFDLLLRAALPFRGPTLGRGLPGLPNWLDLPLADPLALDALARLGWRIHPPRAAVCHWSGYLRPGLFRFYRALLAEPRRTPLPLLRAHLAPVHSPSAATSPLPFRLTAPN
jgi:hypothetical protein